MPKQRFERGKKLLDKCFGFGKCDLDVVNRLAGQEQALPRLQLTLEAAPTDGQLSPQVAALRA